jgi:O-antigen ligase
MLIIGSRFVSQWLRLFGLPLGSVTLEEGSPLDAVVFFVLIAAGIAVLHRRQVNVLEVARNNVWLTVFFVYCFISILWSDFPFISFKRWIKIVGHPVMVLVLFTEPDRDEAVATLIKRCAYLLIPSSILFIKYYPEWGRGFDDWGRAVNIGVTTNKNELGWLCFVLGFFFLWNFVRTRRIEDPVLRRQEGLLSLMFLVMIMWVLYAAHSATSLVSLIVGSIILLALGMRFVRAEFVGIYVVIALAMILVAEGTLDVSAQVLSLLGKDPTLTDRTFVWQDVLSVPLNPFLGAGFESFWLGERREKLAEKWAWQPNQAHNGYLETYLNLGLVGLAILMFLLFATYRKSSRTLLRDFEWGKCRLGFLFSVIVFNWTEATFKALHLVWFAFYIIAIDFSHSTVDGLEYEHERSATA